jgi:hypothetical protein
MGFDEDGDGIGDTELPHQGVDNFPLTDRVIGETKSDSDESPFFLPFYFTILIIVLIIVIIVLKRRKAKGEPSDEDQGILLREL